MNLETRGGRLSPDAVIRPQNGGRRQVGNVVLGNGFGMER